MKRLVQPAKQDRSRETQDRILRATERLLRRESFEAITVRRIVDEASTSIGSFYARFRDKDALLPVLFGEYETRLERRLRDLRRSTAAASSLDDVAEHIVRHFVRMYGEIPNLGRALYEYATRSPEATESATRAKRRYAEYAFVHEALLRFRTEIRHADPARATELAVYFMVVACRNRLFYPLAPQTRMMKLGKRELSDELVRMITGYLRA